MPSVSAISARERPLGPAATNSRISSTRTADFAFRYVDMPPHLRTPASLRSSVETVKGLDWPGVWAGDPAPLPGSGGAGLACLLPGEPGRDVRQLGVEQVAAPH